MSLILRSRNPPTSMSISKDEISRYDRQIRLWGLDGQQKLSSTRIVVLGVNAVSIELLKNLVLAGVGSVCIVDDTKIEETDLSYNYFIRADDIGMLRAPVTLRRLGLLNPRVALTHDERLLHDVPDSWFEDFDVVIACETPYEQLLRINDHTHQRDIKFYACGLLGWGSYIWADLVLHRYQAQKEASNRPTETGSVNFTRTIIEVRPDDDTEVLVIEEKYASLRDAIHKATHLPFASTLRKKQTKQVSPYLPALLAHWESLSVASADIEAKATALGLPQTIFPEGWTHNFINNVSVQLAANASVIAGFLAQDVINCVTKKDHPIQNLMIYDSYEGKGPVYKFY